MTPFLRAMQSKINSACFLAICKHYPELGWVKWKPYKTKKEEAGALSFL